MPTSADESSFAAAAAMPTSVDESSVAAAAAMPPPPFELPQSLGFNELMALLPEHVGKPHPDRLVREWFNLSLQASGPDAISRVDRDVLFSSWSVVAAPRKAVIEQSFARYDHSKRGTVTEEDFAKLAEEMGFGASAARLFEELPKLQNRTVRYSTLMITIAARGASDEMKLLLTAIASRNPSKALEQPTLRTIKRRVWRPGPPKPAIPTEAAIERRKLIAASHATDNPSRGQRVETLTALREAEVMKRMYQAQQKQERTADKQVYELDVLVRTCTPRLARNLAHAALPSLARRDSRS